MPFGAPFPGGANAIIGAFTDSQTQSLGGVSSFTFTSLSFGSASATRVMAAVVLGNATGAPSACTIGGVSATKQVERINGGDFCQIWSAAVPTGTSGNVAMSGANNAIRVGCGLYAMTGAQVTPNVSATDNNNPASGSLVLAAGAFAIGGMISVNGGASSWGGLTRDFDAAVGAGNPPRVSSASVSQPTATTLSISCSQASGTGPAFAAAGWNP